MNWCGVVDFALPFRRGVMLKSRVARVLSRKTGDVDEGFMGPPRSGRARSDVEEARRSGSKRLKDGVAIW